jgi:hypothetical protein
VKTTSPPEGDGRPNGSGKQTHLPITDLFRRSNAGERPSPGAGSSRAGDDVIPFLGPPIQRDQPPRAGVSLADPPACTRPDVLRLLLPITICHAPGNVPVPWNRTWIAGPCEVAWLREGIKTGSPSYPPQGVGHPLASTWRRPQCPYASHARRSGRRREGSEGIRDENSNQS